ncbi:MAG: methyltransferase domain-containing protein [Gammaproteobacteria bacterium]|nr:methyltransferase domain-containing protein [Gammaproteobacteria bacterium]
MDEASKNKWNAIYQKAEQMPQACHLLLEFKHLLKNTEAKALDLAAGLGGNAIFLARLGYEVAAWDISDLAMQKLNQFAKENHLNIKGSVVDLSEPSNWPTALFDVIVISHYLQRELVPLIINALKPKGLLFYQTFTQEVTDEYAGPRNLQFRLAPGELLRLFDSLQCRVYREEGLLGDLSQGQRNIAWLIAQKSE